MFKSVVLLKRKPGMSIKDFVTYYETYHRKLGEKFVPNAKKYVRRYLHAIGNPVTGEVPELPYDVLTELWFENKAEFDKAMVLLSKPEVAAEIAADEDKLFDRSKNCFCTIEERESVLPA
jgi:hypothetical protein